MKRIIFMMAAMTVHLCAWAQAVSIAKVAELSAHRVERLVTLGKIDAGFNTRLEKITVAAVSLGSVAFKSMVSQTQPGTGQPMQLEISFDQAGKPLTFQIVAGGVAGPDPQWSGTDAVTLAEDSLHYLIDNLNDPRLKKFNEGLSTVMLSKGQIGSSDVARGQILSSLTTDKLNVYSKLDGTFISAEIVP